MTSRYHFHSSQRRDFSSMLKSQHNNRSRLLQSHANASFPPIYPIEIVLCLVYVYCCLCNRFATCFIPLSARNIGSSSRASCFTIRLCKAGNRLQGKMGNGLGRTGVAVFWDVQNCPVPENIEPSFIRQRIEATLKEYGYSGSLTIHAYGKLECHTKEALKIAGIDTINFNRAKDTAEKYMLVDISVLASDIRCPAIYMLISEDLGFSHLVDILNQRGYSCLLCHPNPRVSKLLGTAKHVWAWPQLLLDQKSLPMDEARTSLASDNSISNLSLHPNCYDNQDIGFSIRMILLILCCGICRWLGLMSHPKIFDLLFVMVLYTLILHDIEFIDVFGRRQSVHGGAR